MKKICKLCNLKGKVNKEGYCKVCQDIFEAIERVRAFDRTNNVNIQKCTYCYGLGYTSLVVDKKGNITKGICPQCQGRGEF